MNLVTLVMVAAWEPELQRFRALVDPPVDGNLNIDSVGIGLVDATIGMTRCISRHAPTQVVLLGTCGAAPGSHLVVGDVIVGSEVRLVDPATVEGRAALPYASEPVRLDPEMLEMFSHAGARAATIVNPLGITTDDGLAVTLAELGEVEHLEAYGVARACQAASVPCAVVLGVANVVGSQGREQWRANHVAASARAAEVAASVVRTSTKARSLA
jgi:futalosine hydrolase